MEEIYCFFDRCLKTHQPLWVISVSGRNLEYSVDLGYHQHYQMDAMPNFLQSKIIMVNVLKFQTLFSLCSDSQKNIGYQNWNSHCLSE